MKRIFSLLLCVLVVALVACSADSDLITGGGFVEDTSPPVKVTGSTSGGSFNAEGSTIDGEKLIIRGGR